MSESSIYRELSSAVIVYHNTGAKKPMTVPHLHAQYEIYYNVSGCKSFFAGENFYACSTHDLFVIPKTQIHKAVPCEEEKYDRYIINIDNGIINAISNIPNMSHSLYWLDEAGVSIDRHITLDKTEHACFIKLLENYISAENKADDMGLFIRLLQILDFVGSRFKKPNTEDVLNTIPKTWSDQAILLVEKNFRSVTVAQISKQLFVNKEYLCRVFLNETGMTLHNYIIARRIAEAKRLLFLGAMVKEVSSLAGFKNYSTFIRTFKKFEGYPPCKLEKLSDPL